MWHETHFSKIRKWVEAKNNPKSTYGMYEHIRYVVSIAQCQPRRVQLSQPCTLLSLNDKAIKRYIKPHHVHIGFRSTWAIFPGMIWLILKLGTQYFDMWATFLWNYGCCKDFNIGWTFPIRIQIKLQISQISELSSNLKQWFTLVVVNLDIIAYDL